MPTPRRKRFALRGASPAHDMTVVKICGLRTAEHALAAATAGADMLGLMFAPSSRRIAPVEAAALVSAVRQHPTGQRVQFVGVFVNESPTTMDTIADQVGLDYVQLSGDESPDQAFALHTAWIKAIRFDGSALERIWLATATAQPLLIDAHVPGSYGGSGQHADWGRAAATAAQRPILLAGGLTPASVPTAIAQTQPWGVDVSSGVESAGVKDIAKIAAFIAAVRSATHKTLL